MKNLKDESRLLGAILTYLVHSTPVLLDAADRRHLDVVLGRASRSFYKELTIRFLMFLAEIGEFSIATLLLGMSGMSVDVASEIDTTL